MPRHSATGSRALVTEERLAQIWEFRKLGYSYGQIAQQIGLDKSNIYRLVKRKFEQLAKQNFESADDVRRMELERLDDILKPLMLQARQGNHGAADRVLRIMERRAKLLGLDAPTRQETSGPNGGAIEISVMTPEQRRARIAELLAKREQPEA